MKENNDIKPDEYNFDKIRHYNREFISVKFSDSIVRNGLQGLASFLEHPPTLRLYLQTLEELQTYLEPKQITLLTVEAPNIADWLNRLQEIGNKAPTIERKLATLKKFYEHMSTSYSSKEPPKMSYNPMGAKMLKDKIKKTKSKYSRKKFEGISHENFKAIIGALDRTTVAGLRDLALLSLYYYTGRRLFEGTRITWKHLDFKNFTYSYVAKGGRGWTDDIPPIVIRRLINYLKARWGETFWEILNEKPNTYIFSATNTIRGKKKERGGSWPLSHSYIWKLVNLKLIPKAGIRDPLDPKQKKYLKLRPHQFRHSHAHMILKQGGSHEEIRQRLNHRSINTSGNYTQGMEIDSKTIFKNIQKLVEDFED